MTFAAPTLLWLLLVIPPAILALFWWSARRRDQLMRQFIAARLLPNLLAGFSPARRKLRIACLATSVALIVIALARPQFGFTWQEVRQRGVDILVAIDCSKSMLAQDIAPNRLARAKLAALELMQRARTDRLGLIAFAGTAFLACPLTIDDAAFGQSVDGLDVNTVSQGGTALAEAIKVATEAFKEGDNHKLLILMSDGEDHDSGAVEAAQAAGQAGMRIYTIGIGTPEGELMRFTTQQGSTDYIRDEQGNVVKSRLNEQLLKDISGATTGGFYALLRGAKTMDTVYDEGIATLTKAEHQEKLVKQYHERFHWPLAAAIVLIIVEMLLPERRRLRTRSPAGAKAAPAAPAVVTAFAVLFAPSVFAASPGRALREYKSGNYDAALQQYQQLLKRKSDDPRLHFNAGAAAYKSQQYEEAARLFGEALSTPDVKLQQLAFYNRGNSHYFLGEKIDDPQQRISNWEKAVKDYEMSLKLEPKDADAEFNREFVKRRLEELKQNQKQDGEPEKVEPSEAAKKAKAEADECVRARQYGKALEIMEAQLAIDSTTRAYSDFIQRLKEVTGVQDPGKN